MKTCLNCNKEFHGYAMVEGKKKALYSRKYCLECSPWGSHRTRPFDWVPMENKEIHCERCGKKYLYKRHSHMSRFMCSSCSANKKRLTKRYQIISERGGKCERCGYSKCLSALEFHHNNASEKEMLVTGNFSMERLRGEAKKCTLLCANCHREEHDKQFSLLRSSRLAEHSPDKRGVVGAPPTATTIL